MWSPFWAGRGAEAKPALPLDHVKRGNVSNRVARKSGPSADRNQTGRRRNRRTSNSRVADRCASRDPGHQRCDHRLLRQQDGCQARVFCRAYFTGLPVGDDPAAQLLLSCAAGPRAVADRHRRGTGSRRCPSARDLTRWQAAIADATTAVNNGNRDDPANDWILHPLVDGCESTVIV